MVFQKAHVQWDCVSTREDEALPLIIKTAVLDLAG